ncbi:oligopeptide/dipeptide ABC transporter ATP-binding protein [Paenibacillus sp. GCM10027626]|uniref:oligopeptide/dipeptide ABC transporter ATP-binding protein n=1 Tax=Paenibacillus sp. GCM10027626 TaxID=3273411 RepID=UPI0036301D87
MSFLTLNGLSKTFARRPQTEPVAALDGISLIMAKGESLAVIGESGSGKSTLAKIIARLETADAGSIYYKGKDISSLTRDMEKSVRRNIQIIFQDPAAALNPRKTVREILEEPLRNFESFGREARLARIAEMLETVKLAPHYLSRYPHELSGGQCQRICVARALICRPELVLCDEPVSSLDASLQAEIIALMKRLKEIFGLSYLFISHNLAAVAALCDRVAVMYLGQMMEIFPVHTLGRRPNHPYTQLLLASMPVPDPRRRQSWNGLSQYTPKEEGGLSRGCKFYHRCPLAEPICRIEKPPLLAMGEGQLVACHYTDKMI